MNDRARFGITNLLIAIAERSDDVPVTFVLKA